MTIVTSHASSRHERSLAIIEMRQRWINELRDASAQFVGLARDVHVATRCSEPLRTAATVLLGRLEYITIKLNPNEPHSEMVRLAFAALARGAGADDQLRGRVRAGNAMIEPDFDLLARWATLLVQLVLKMEWIRVSGSDDHVTRRVRDQWTSLRAFENTHHVELSGICGDVMAYRQQRARSLIDRPDAWWMRRPDPR